MYLLQYSRGVYSRVMKNLIYRVLCSVYACNVYISSEKINRSDFYLTTTGIIKKEGYKAEEHTVITEDGYILTLHRIPGKAGSPSVLLAHGLGISSFEWVLSKQEGLGFILADNNYDVWLGNARGNVYSRHHLNCNSSQFRFWDFSWHEMGIYDLPAMINYITNIKNDSLFFIGHSMGATTFFVMASEKPEIATKIKAMFGFGPAAFMHHFTSPIRYITPYVYRLEKILKSLGVFEIFPPEIISWVQDFNIRMCINENLLNENNACLQILLAIAGYNPSNFNYKLLPLIFSHTPEGMSVKTLLHYLQLGLHGYFRYYNYDVATNLKKYNNSEPPHYNLSKIQAPVGLFWSEKDYFAHPLDVKKLYDLLPRKILNYKVPNPDFSHLDYIYGINAKKIVYPILLSVMEKYR